MCSPKQSSRQEPLSQYFPEEIARPISDDRHAKFGQCSIINKIFIRNCTPINVGRWANFGQCSIINPTSIGFEETSFYWLVQIFSVFHWSPSPERIEISLITGSDQKTPRAVHSCNSWFFMRTGNIRIRSAAHVMKCDEVISSQCDLCYDLPWRAVRGAGVCVARRKRYLMRAEKQWEAGQPVMLIRYIDTR